ncbi:hypothetical protein [Sorangium sp. So ce124]|uniref:hypothetical protein n=1 Tax=Sorangium sp. So ce124 TaxID=3133280 RepID=UPI003F5D5821
MKKEDDKKSLESVLGRIAKAAADTQEAESKKRADAKSRNDDVVAKKAALKELVTKHVRPVVDSIVLSLKESNLSPNLTTTREEPIQAAGKDSIAYGVEPSIMVTFKHPLVPGHTSTIAVGEHVGRWAGFLNICAHNGQTRINTEKKFRCVKRLNGDDIASLLEASAENARESIKDYLAQALDHASSQ